MGIGPFIKEMREEFNFKKFQNELAKQINERIEKIAYLNGVIEGLLIADAFTCFVTEIDGKPVIGDRLVVRKEIKNETFDLNEISEINTKDNIMLVLFGLAGIIGGGTLVVDNAQLIAEGLGMDPLLVGLTVVSIGTSLPELITSIVAAKKGENDIAVGNAIGSSLFNIVLILGLASTINPMIIGMENIVDISVMFASAFIIFIMAFGKAKVTNWKGIILLIIYVAYFTYIVLRNYGII